MLEHSGGPEEFSVEMVMKKVMAKGNHVTTRSAEIEWVVRVRYRDVLCFFTESESVFVF